MNFIIVTCMLVCMRQNHLSMIIYSLYVCMWIRALLRCFWAWAMYQTLGEIRKNKSFKITSFYQGKIFFGNPLIFLCEQKIISYYWWQKNIGEKKYALLGFDSFVVESEQCNAKYELHSTAIEKFMILSSFMHENVFRSCNIIKVKNAKYYKIRMQWKKAFI